MIKSQIYFIRAGILLVNGKEKYAIMLNVGLIIMNENINTDKPFKRKHEFIMTRGLRLVATNLNTFQLQNSEQ